MIYNLSNIWRSNVTPCLMGTKKFSHNLLTTLKEVSSIMNSKMPLREQRKVDVFSFNIHQMEYGILKFLKKVSFLFIGSKSSSFGSLIKITCINIVGLLINISRSIIRWSKDTSIKIQNENIRHDKDGKCKQKVGSSAN